MGAIASLSLASFAQLSWPIRLLCFYLAGAMALGVLFSLSRGSWVALGVGEFVFLFFFLRHEKLSRHVFWSLGESVLIGFLVTLFWVDRMEERVELVVAIVRSNQWKEEVRIQLARDAWRIFQDQTLEKTIAIDPSFGPAIEI